MTLCQLVRRCIRGRKSYDKVPSHPPLYCIEEKFKGFDLRAEEVQALQKVLKNQLYI